jgi:hypothetical protein
VRHRHYYISTLCKDAILPRESGVCERKCTDSESIWSTGVRGREGGVALGRGGAGPLREVVEPIIYIYIIHLIYI